MPDAPNTDDIMAQTQAMIDRLRALLQSSDDMRRHSLQADCAPPAPSPAPPEESDNTTSQ